MKLRSPPRAPRPRSVVVEVLSASLSNKEHARHFTWLEPASCPGAVHVNRSLSEMDTVRGPRR